MNLLTVNADLDALEPIAQYVTQAAQVAGLDNRASYKLRLAADELATNIITYGYSESGLSGNINVLARLAPQCLEISFEDSCPPYNLEEAPVPDLNLSLEDRPVGGLGVYLIMTSVDRVFYERVNDRNRTTLVINKV